jgi:hypothetical protein
VDKASWSGYVSQGGTVSVALSCVNDRRSVVAEVTDDRLGDTNHIEQGHAVALDDPARRLPVARLATDTAVRAAEEWACEATPGRPLTQVPLPLTWDEYDSAAQAEVPRGFRTGTQ